MWPILDSDLPEHPCGPYVRGRGGRPSSHPPSASVRGGSVTFNPSGYVFEHSPDHPAARGTRKQLPQHRLVMECMLGRLLDAQEVVHHRNRVRHDNRAANLEIHDRSTHGVEHGDDTRARCLAPLTEETVRVALDGRTTREAADMLGVHHMTLRNRFPHLLTKRRSPGGDFSPEFVERVRELATDPTVGTRHACTVLNVTDVTLRACRAKHDIPWIAAPFGRPKKRV